jgi:hypothetical protein
MVWPASRFEAAGASLEPEPEPEPDPLQVLEALAQEPANVDGAHAAFDDFEALLLAPTAASAFDSELDDIEAMLLGTPPPSSSAAAAMAAREAASPEEAEISDDEDARRLTKYAESSERRGAAGSPSGAEYAHFLNAVPLCAALSDEDRQKLGGVLETVAFAPGEAIIRQNEEADAMYIVLNGVCEALGKDTRNPPLLAISRSFLTDCV